MSHSRTSARGIARPTRSLLVALLVALVSLFAVGCGSSSEDYVVNGNDNTPPAPPAATGSVTLQLAKAQATVLPEATLNLSIEFFDRTSTSVLGPLTRPFAPTITIEGVPTSATLVRVTAFDVNNNPIAMFSAIFDVVPGGNVEATMGQATLADLVLTPYPSDIKMLVNETNNISLDVAFAFGPVTLPARSASAIGGGSYYFTSDNPLVAQVDANSGDVTGTSIGNTTVRVTFTLNGVSKTAPIPVHVTGLVVTPTIVNLNNTTTSYVLSTTVDGYNVDALGVFEDLSGVTATQLIYTNTTRTVRIGANDFVNGTARLVLNFTAADGFRYNSVPVTVNVNRASPL